MSSLSFNVAAGANDAWADAYGTFNNTGTFVWLGGTPDLDGDPETWFSFIVTLPKALVISQALLKVVCSQSRGDTIGFIAGCAAEDNATDPVDYVGLTGKSMSAARVTHEQAGMTAGQLYTYDITTPVQEILNRAGWASGNRLGVYIRTNGHSGGNRQQVAAFEHATYSPAALEITWPTFIARSPGLI